MRRESLTKYDEMPEAMVAYLRHCGPHFNRKLCEFATSRMTKENDTPVDIMSKEDVTRILQQNNIKLKNNQLYDYVFVANMCKADFLNSSVPDVAHLAKYIKDVIDDPDGYDGIVFNRWYADMCYTGVPIDWEEML